eukprot:TRINITY_DN25884_c0_g1_i1.p3 TRINITY_DN25884_c0_g1~~TRINITY_DN25884_c0_g1_i1.p3  ORF type:complete len:161 (+),score=46.85 TRINITY_DN25884_c0_g1_i1:144-626(+)
MLRSLVGSEMCIRDRVSTQSTGNAHTMTMLLLVLLMTYMTSSAASRSTASSSGWIDVTDFGAVGDGQTDDHASISSALANISIHGGTIYLPPGEYALSESLVVSGWSVAIQGAGMASPGCNLSLIHISEPTRLLSISYAVFCLKKKKSTNYNRLVTRRDN